MKLSTLAILSLNLFPAISAASVLTKRQTKAESECSLVECIVNLAELPLLITTCAEAIEDFNDLSANRDSLKLELQAADCIAEATLSAIELPEHCGGCLAALDGECPDADVPCTGPPSS